MKVFLILASVALAAAAPQYADSGVPDAPRPVYGQPGVSQHQDASGNYHQGQSGGKVYRHVYVHVSPKDEDDSQTKIIRVPGTADKHVNIIFVKAPSTSFAANTEIELPQQNEQKTLVYVLLKKPDSASDLKIRGPAPTRPSKPEVFFIRYKDQNQGGQIGQIGQSQQQQQGGSSSYAPPAPINKPSGSYGLPF